MVEGDAVLAAELLDVLASLDLSELDNSARVPLERIQLIQ
jgi:hypothetical protein